LSKKIYRIVIGAEKTAFLSIISPAIRSIGQAIVARSSKVVRVLPLRCSIRPPASAARYPALCRFYLG